MNKVNYNTKKVKELNICYVSDMTGENFNVERTAFLGRLLHGDTIELYLVTFYFVFKPDDPTNSWSYDHCKGVIFEIKEWVDVEFSIIEKQ
jgi:hypothetical protein